MSNNRVDTPSRSMVLYDDSRARDFEPFATSRPLSEMRAGALLVRERWSHVLRARAEGFVSSAHLARFAEFDAPRALTNDEIPEGAWLVNTRALPHLGLDTNVVDSHDVLSIDGQPAALRLDKATKLPLADGAFAFDAIGASSGKNAEIDGVWINEVWDIIAMLSPLLKDDIPTVAKLTRSRMAEPGNQLAIIGDHPVWMEPGAVVEPFVTFDTSAGPVLLRRGAYVQGFTRVVGPCYIGEQSSVMGDRIANCSIGPTCRVHGEVSSSIFIGHANKGHDGFVGHSVLGRWVNLGAGTITSNLKNTYGAVSLWTPTGTRWTGQQFLGTLFGDHVKTGIGLRLTTGCVLGAGSNVYNAMPPKMVKPFTWGGGAGTYTEFEADKFIATAGRMMQRRNVVLDEEQQAYLRGMYAAATSDARWERE